MSFAIEVPGEALPLTLFDLGRALENAAVSSDHTQRQAATKQLQTWESHPDYFPALQVGEMFMHICLVFMSAKQLFLLRRPRFSTRHFAPRSASWP